MSSLLHEEPSNSEMIDLGGGRTILLGETVGRGTFATVQRGLLCSAHDVARPVAVKLFGNLSSDEQDLELKLLIRTIQRLAYLDHPNAVRVYEGGVWQGRPFVVTELVGGIALDQFHYLYSSKRRRMPLDLALFILSEVAEALAGARLTRDHAGGLLGILHQSLSARDVLLSWRGEVKVADFEIGTARPSTSTVRSLRGLALRAVTMAPEVAQGAVADSRADVFSFGILVRELLVGPRFPSPLTDTEAISLARKGFVQPITFQPQLPTELATLISRAIEVRPEARYPNAGVLALDLRRIALGMGVGDGRYFLRSTLGREWAQHREEVTRPQGNVYELPLKKRRK